MKDSNEKMNEFKNQNQELLKKYNSQIKKDVEKNESFTNNKKTISYLFKRTKDMSRIISEFHLKNMTKQNLNVTQDYIINYDSSVKKLKEIFD